MKGPETLKRISSSIFLLYLTLQIISIGKVSGSTLSTSTDTFFKGELESDQIIYTRIVIPRYTNKVVIKIYAVTAAQQSKYTGNAALNDTESEPDLDNTRLPIALLKYNGLPTLDNFDAVFQLFKAPMSLQITDFKPDESELFIGLWGGYLLHSFRYFAGSPSVFLVGIEIIIIGTNFLTCRNTIVDSFPLF